MTMLNDQTIYLPDRTAFAGSVAATDRRVRTMVQIAKVSMADAVKITNTPADHDIILPQYQLIFDKDF